MRIATYNVHHCAEGIDAVAAVIKDMDADIVGIQEADRFTGRTGNTDQPELLAQKAGMPYYHFTKNIDFQGGDYGTMILSKYPLTVRETIALFSGGYEARSASHFSVEINGVRTDFFNTHLSYESKEVRALQFAALGEALKKSPLYVLTGDFNTDDFEELSVLSAKTMINRPRRTFVSFPETGSAIDNILLSEGLTEIRSYMVTRSHSDHCAIVSEISFTG